MENVLIINLNWRCLAKIGRLRKYDPLISQELLYISEDMKRKRLKSRYTDLWAENKDIADYKEIIKKSDIVILCSAPSYHFWQDGTVDEELPKTKAMQIKEINPDAKIIVVGPHGSIMPKTFFNEGFDYIIRGEPDLVAAELVKQIRKNKITLDCICYRKENKWMEGKSIAIVKDMSKLPIIHYDKINHKKYSWPSSPEGHKFKIVSVYEASRGCPFFCTFCFRAGFRGRYRVKSIKQIRKELKLMKKAGIEYFFLIDEIFGVGREWTIKVCKEIKKTGIKWGCESRPEYLDKEMIKIWKNSGCLEVRFGLESANRDVLNAVGKGSTDLEKLKSLINFMTENNINVKLFCIAGLPKSNKETIKETLDYIMQFDLLKVNAATNIMIPFPGTKVWEQGIKEGKKLETWNDMPKYAGIIDNSFKSPKKVLKEVARFNAYIQKRKSVLRLKKGCNIIRSILTYLGCWVIIAFPITYPFFEKIYKLFRVS